MNNTMLLWSILVIIAARQSQSTSNSSPKKPPHIIFVMADDLGWNDIAYPNISAVQTPNIDRLAKGGVKLRNYYVNSMCTPTRGALLTGKYPIHTGMQHFVINSTSPWGMPRDVTTLPQKLRSLAINIVKNHNQEKPLYLMLSYTAPHTPLQAHQSNVNKYTSVKDKDRRIYLAMVDGMDQGIGKLVDACKAKGIWRDALFVLVSDNGGLPGPAGGYNWPLRGIKSTVWEVGVRAGGFVLGSMIHNPGREIKDLIHVTDWYPTLVKLAVGSTANEKIDGVDQSDVLTKGERSPRDEISINFDYAPNLYWEEYNPRGLTYFTGAAVRVGDMKLLHKCPNSSWYPLPEHGHQPPTFETFAHERLPYFEFALCNVTADPEERHDLSAKYPDIVQQLYSRLKFYNSTAVPYRLQPEDPKSLVIAARYGRWEPWRDEDAKSSSVSLFYWLTIDFLFLSLTIFF